MKKIVLLVLSLCLVIVFTAGCLKGGQSLKTGQVTGVVLDSSSNKPISNAEVTVYGQTLKTNQHGKFYFEEVLAGEQTVKVDAFLYAKQEVPITVPQNQATDLTVELLGDAHTLSGYVRDQSGNVRAGARVSLSGVSGNFEVIADEQGFYSFVLESGKYYVHIDQRAYDYGFTYANDEVTLAEDVTRDFYIWFGNWEDLYAPKKDPTIIWRPVEAFGPVTYRITVTKSDWNAILEQKINLNGSQNEYTLTGLTVGSNYDIHLEALNPAGQTVLEIWRSMYINGPLDNPLNLVEQYMNNLQDAFNVNDMPAFSTLISGSYRDSLGRDKKAIMKYLTQMREKHRWVFPSKMDIEITAEQAGVPLGAAVKLKIYTTNFIPQFDGTYDAEFVLVAEQGELKISSAILTNQQ